MIKVLVAAPPLALRAGLSLLLATDAEIEVVGEAAVLPGAHPVGLSADVLVVAGFDLDEVSEVLESRGEDISTEGAPPALLLLVEDPPDLNLLLERSSWRAWGLLPVDCSAEELLAAVKALHQGLVVGDPLLLGPYLSLERGSSSGQASGSPASGLPASGLPAPGVPALDAPAPEALTEREAQVLQLIAQGLANKQIAAALGISEHTVKFHVSAIYSKLGANSRTEAVRLGVRQGLVVL